MFWKKIITSVAADAEAFFDRQKHRINTRLGRTDPIHIIAYRGYGTRQLLKLKGRVLEQKRPPVDEDNETIWTNMLQMYRRFESDEVPGVNVQASFQGRDLETTTDEEGYFEFSIPVREDLPSERLWHDASLKLVNRQGDAKILEVVAAAQVLVPPARSTFGVISDIDDTIVRTNAANFIKMAWLTFINSARTRLPFKGVAAFYRALHGSGMGSNPIFYLSSSPWNLYDLLVDFMEINRIPAGPLLLRDLGIDKEKFITTGHYAHKRAQIEHLLTTYPSLPFLLIGDSGQHDPEIFETVIEDFPGRILAIYIRDVSDPDRDASVQAIANRIRENGVEMLLVPDTRAAAEHAASRGYITSKALVEIESEQERDAQPPERVEQLLSNASFRVS